MAIDKHLVDPGLNVNPSRLRRHMNSRALTKLADSDTLDSVRDAAEAKRSKAGEPHLIEYFHQFDDPYSHLAAQCLKPLLQTYDVQLRIHLVRAESDTPGRGQQQRLRGQMDCLKVAPHYNVDFPQAPVDCTLEAEQTALKAAVGGRGPELTDLLVELGDALWTGNQERLNIAADDATVDQADIERRVRAGNTRRDAIGANCGGVFFYGGEVFKGIDRLHHLEDRLTGLGLRRQKNGRKLVAPRPVINPGTLTGGKDMELEIFLSLNCPYCAIAYERATKLARATGVKLTPRPVLRWVMDVNSQETINAVRDASREAHKLGLNWGRVADPQGQPMRQTLALWQWATEKGRGRELLEQYLRAVWSEGRNLTRPEEMRNLVKRAGLSWAEAQNVLELDDWRATVRENHQAFKDAGFGPVPAMRLLDGSRQVLVETSGQDRLWLIASVLQRFCEKRRTFLDEAKTPEVDEGIDFSQAAVA